MTNRLRNIAAANNAMINHAVRMNKLVCMLSNFLVSFDHDNA